MAETPVGLARLLGLDDDPGRLLDALRTVVDPELGVDVVSLGLVYGAELAGGVARVRLTMTTPSCPVGPYLVDQARWALLSVDGVLDAEVKVVHEPRWSPDMMSDEAKARLGWLR